MGGLISGSAEAGDHLGTQGGHLGLCPLNGVGYAHCLVWGWLGTRWSVRVLLTTTERQPWAGGTEKQWPLLGDLSGGSCWGPLVSWGPGAEELLTAPGSPPTSNPKGGQPGPWSLARALRLPRPPPWLA